MCNAIKIMLEPGSTPEQLWAHWYAEHGIVVVPLIPREKRPAIPWREFQQCRPSLETTSALFASRPNAGLAGVLGSISDLLVIDVDGAAAHDALIKQLGEIPLAPTAISGSREPCRYHLFFRHPDVTTRAKATPWHPTLEFRGTGGLVVLPPSVHASGHRYEWVAGRAIWELPLPAVPDLILEAIQNEADRHQVRNGYAVKGFVEIPQIQGISHATEDFLRGQYAAGPRWNERLFVAACDLAGNGILRDDAEPLLLAGAQPVNATEAENAVRTIESAYAQARIPSRQCAEQAISQEPINTFDVGGVTVRQFMHPSRRQLPVKTSFHFGVNE
jgi:hypothetical protein